MKHLRLLVPASDEHFDETGYLHANPDVARAVSTGVIACGYDHFDAFGRHESRNQRVPIPAEWKSAKLARARACLRDPNAGLAGATAIDCLDDTLRERCGVIATDNISAHEYDHRALELIERHRDGWVLDCGAGMRGTYYTHVLNTEIVAYDSTDVLAVAECLPFRDGCFDAVLSLNVLEHVKNPFAAAAELIRVLRPGGELLCVAPFMQPLHGYPHHYYNMTREGLSNLFAGLNEQRFEIYGAMHPIWALQWFLTRYAHGLPAAQRDRFEAMTVSQLLAPATQLELDAIATELASGSCIELASAHALRARKPSN